MARLAHCVPASSLSPAAILAAAVNLQVDVTVIGPEAPLVNGVVDHFRAANLPIVGPTAEAAQLEGSKQHAKSFFAQHQIPTARFELASSQQEVVDALRRFTLPVVVKADGLAAGKGVIIARTEQEAQDACSQLGPNLVIEEFLEGPEVSYIVLCDGKSAIPFLPARDHKRAFDGDLGPNTGGMGAYCHEDLLSQQQTAQVLESIILPTLQATGFTGFLYAGLILTTEGPKLLEYNVRLGDPETQVLMSQIDDNLPELLLAAAHGALSQSAFRWKPGASHGVVLASQGYPGPHRSSDTITGLEEAEKLGAAIFHAGTRVGWSGYVTAGGRVLTVVHSGADLEQAARNTYRAVDQIHFEGMHYRHDIGRAPNPL